MAKIMKARAKKFCAVGPLESVLYPYGVGGMEGKPIVALAVDEYTVYLTKEEAAIFVDDLNKLLFNRAEV